MAENKITFGLKNAHYAKITVDNTGKITYATPKAIPGSTELSLDPRGDMTEFYADDMLYYSASNNQGYDGTLTLANITDDFAIDILGEEKDETDSVITEKSTAKSSYFALMFEFDGDIKAVRHVLYYCSASRPSIGSSTKTDTADPNTVELTFVASARPGDYSVKTKTTTTTPTAVYDGWYDSVYDKATTPLNVTVAPADNATGIAVGSSVTWTFDKELKADTIGEGNFFLMNNATGSEVLGALTIDSTGKIVTFKPTVALAATTKYVATATKNVKAKDNSVLASNKIIDFTTA